GPTTTTMRSNASSQLAIRWRSIGRPAIRYTAFGRRDFIRVPRPAARRTAVVIGGARTPPASSRRVGRAHRLLRHFGQVGGRVAKPVGAEGEPHRNLHRSRHDAGEPGAAVAGPAHLRRIVIELEAGELLAHEIAA